MSTAASSGHDPQPPSLPDNPDTRASGPGADLVLEARGLLLKAGCRSPLGFLLGSWRDGLRGGLHMGAKNGAWCVGCCWALMASLFALGIMSIRWMALIAGLIAIEKTLPWRRTASYGTAAVLLALGVLVLAAPHAVPGLTTPSEQPAQMNMP